MVRLKDEKYGGSIIKFEKHINGVSAYIYVKGLQGAEKRVFGATKEQALKYAVNYMRTHPRG